MPYIFQKALNTICTAVILCWQPLLSTESGNWTVCQKTKRYGCPPCDNDVLYTWLLVYDWPYSGAEGQGRWTFEPAHKIIVLSTQATSEGPGEIRAVSPEPSLFAHIKYGSTRRVPPNIWHLATLDGMRVRRMSLRRKKSTIISWEGSFYINGNWSATPVDKMVLRTVVRQDGSTTVVRDSCRNCVIHQSYQPKDWNTCKHVWYVCLNGQSKMISNDQELIQSDPTSYPQNQKGNN